MDEAPPAPGSRGWLVGADIGGTFTDVVAVEASSGARRSAKVLTTPDDPIRGVVEGIEAARAGAFEWADVIEVVHGTTLAINTLLERKGPPVALLTTYGFRDVLETGNANRYDIYDLQLEAQPPLVPRRLRLGVRERVDAKGEVLVPLDEGSLGVALSALEEARVESVAVCFLHAYASDVHEVAAGQVVAGRLPNVHLSLSSEIAPIIREYERTVATAVNAYIGPVISRYLTRLADELRRLGFNGHLGIMKSDGGTCLLEEASERPIQILESGPAAGALATAAVATLTGEKIALAFDMGGTTAKACLIQDGRPLITEELEVSRRARFKKGSGLPIRLPSVDLVEVGTGGSSIASIGALGLMAVGPSSAGSVPGPACYRRGGKEPTVTDADLVLGYLDPATFAGGTIELDSDAAAHAIRSELCAGSEASDVVGQAWAIHNLANESMSLAIRLHCVEHGVDPGAVTLVATGGAGPVHAAHVMQKLGARHLICAPDAGVASAAGLILAPTTIELTVTDLVQLADIGEDEIRERLDALIARVRSARKDGDSFESIVWLHMRRRGQGHEIRVGVEGGLAPGDLEQAFRAKYRELYGRAPAQGPIEIVNWSVTIHRTRGIEALAPPVLAASGDRTATRSLYFGPERGWVESAVLTRADLESAATAGPLIVQEAETSIVVPPGMSARRDEWENIHVEVQE